MTESEYYAYKSAIVSLVFWDHHKYVTLTGLKSKEKSKGHATELMKWIISIADKEQFILILMVKPFDDEDLNASQLESFYTKFDFIRESDDIPIFMRRSPLIQEPLY